MSLIVRILFGSVGLRKDCFTGIRGAAGASMVGFALTIGLRRLDQNLSLPRACPKRGSHGLLIG